MAWKLEGSEGRVVPTVADGPGFTKAALFGISGTNTGCMANKVGGGSVMVGVPVSGALDVAFEGGVLTPGGRLASTER
jgi:hypothetical protein